MKIYINNQLIARGNAHNESPQAWVVQSISNVQVVEALRSPSIEAWERGNQRHRVRFEVRRMHSTAEAAATHALTHATALRSAQGLARFVSEDAGGEIHLDSAALVKVEASVQGLFTVHSYELVGGKLSAGEGGQHVG